MTTLTVSPLSNALAAKEFLQKTAGLSLTAWRKLKREGLFEVNGQACSPGQTWLFPGDTVRFDLTSPCRIKPVEAPLSIRYEDAYLIIADKPAGLLVHPTAKERENTLANAVLFHLQQRGAPLAFHPVHRLDRNTSGLLLIAKLPHIQHLLSKQRLHRAYIAVAAGRLNPAASVICAPIARQSGSIITRQVDRSGRTALTRYRVLAAYPRASLLRLVLLTGRTHQIRVHLSDIGHPLLGDDLYGGSRARIGRQALHAAALSLIHPVTGRPLSFHSPLPADMRRLIADCQKQ